MKRLNLNSTTKQFNLKYNNMKQLSLNKIIIQQKNSNIATLNLNIIKFKLLI